MLLNRKKFVVSAALIAGLVTSATGYAQPASQTSPPAAPSAKSPTQAPPRAGAPAPNQPAGLGSGPERLNLTEAQREQIRTLREAQRTDQQLLREKMSAARQQLRQAMRADVPDEAAVRAAVGAVAALQADQAVLQARARAQFMEVLTPEQQARMKEARARAAQRAQRAERAVRAQRARRQLILRNWMMRPGSWFYRGWWRGWI